MSVRGIEPRLHSSETRSLMELSQFEVLFCVSEQRVSVHSITNKVGNLRTTWHCGAFA